MQTDHRLLGRAAGLLYLVIIACGIGSEVFIRGSLYDDMDISVTAANILADSALFKTGFLADSIMLLCDVAIAIVFYRLFRQVDKTLALSAMVFRLVQAVIIGMSLLFYYAAYLLLTIDAQPDGQTNTMLSLLIDMHAYGYDLGLIFFAIANVALGVLVIRSGFCPRVLGYGLAMAAVVYVVGSYTRFMAVEYHAFVEPIYLIPLLAELAFSLWLLFGKFPQDSQDRGKSNTVNQCLSQ
ncbi:MAG: DUF4386 domain-containing protein [gamma proteobacterium endosymbiont of Lamellibrachia anaximandri]|nr:DUF4386 domain-containing protein [gamma proteobacterium endosymbiont of Lamellibrachia anaximandri]MBL3535505.1 DUF4386 domain-containing protein [gamma proteobacterium endosymbiont of Lamellibrachia anaximandri]